MLGSLLLTMLRARTGSYDTLFPVCAAHAGVLICGRSLSVWEAFCISMNHSLPIED